MGFRIVEINTSSELHIAKGNLLIIQKETTFTIPIEDIESLVLAGNDIRISSNGISALAQAGVMLVTCGSNNMPQAFMIPTEANVRQTLISHKQLELSQSQKNDFWDRLIIQKIENQSRCLSILEKNGSLAIGNYANLVHDGDIENAEAQAVKEYFSYLNEGLNRRSEDPFNSVLNYGYAVLRSSIVKELASTGFITCIGLHHHNQFNTFNLADDLIEPFRPFVDVYAGEIVNSNTHLTKTQRHALIGIQHHACLINDIETSVIKGIKSMVDSYKRAILFSNPELLQLPVLIHPRTIHGIEE